MDKIRVLIVDDSSFIRTSLKKILDIDPIVVVGVAVNGEEAVKMNEELQPDVITLDIEMPKMNGLQALKEIMDSDNPCNVIMLSSLTQDGANSTVEALESGAVDFIAKKDAFSGIHSLKDELIGKILNVTGNSDIANDMQRKKSLRTQKSSKGTAKETAKEDVAGAESALERLRKRNLERKSVAEPSPMNKVRAAKVTQKKSTASFRINRVSERERPDKISLITIGISTGGPAALVKTIPQLPKNLPVPILIAQHMPPHFTESLARRLDSKSQVSVKEAQDGDMIHAGHVYVAPGGRQMYLTGSNKLTVSDHPADELYKPSVNVMFESALKHHKMSTLAVIMTGMGHDGRDAVKKLRAAKSYVLAQSPETSVAPGMPESITGNSLADEIYDLDHMGQAIASFFE